MSIKEEVSKGKKNAVSIDLIKSKIKDVVYSTEVVFGKRFMRCYIMLECGFIHIGEPSVCMDDSNFNEEDGKLISYENTFNGLWKLVAYELMLENSK